MIPSCESGFILMSLVVSGRAGTGQVTASLGMPAMLTPTLLRMSLAGTAQVIDSKPDRPSTQTTQTRENKDNFEKEKFHSNDRMTR